MASFNQVTLGVMPLTDAAPLVIAEAKGFFAEENLDVALVREVSWATIRDRVMFGAFEAAQMLAPMPLAMSFGLGHQPRPTIAPMVLSLNGNGVTVSKALKAAIERAAPESLRQRPIRAGGLAKVIDKRRASRLPKLVFGVVFPYSTHHLQLRAWLKDAGIEPDRDLELVVVPPSQMAGELEAGRLDGYCVGEPWNQQAVRNGVGCLLITSSEFWTHRAEKVLGVQKAFAEREPETLQALLRALIRAGAWLDRIGNRLEAARLLVEGGWVDAPIDVVGLSLLGIIAHERDETPRLIPDMHVFSRYAAGFPWLGQAAIYAEAMVEAGQLERLPSLDDLAAIFRPDLYRIAAKALDLTLPRGDVAPDDDEWARWQDGVDGDAALLLSSPVSPQALDVTHHANTS